MIITRRRILLFSATLPLSARSSEFWNRKDPSEWSTDEVDRLITKSPWAKEIVADARRNRYSGLVRWESAKPVLDAMKAPLPREFSNHYVISVSGIPMSSLRPAASEGAEGRARQREVEGVLAKLKSLTNLELKGARPAQPGIVQETPLGIGETRTVLFGFSKALVLSPEYEEVVFTTQMETIPVKAKFILKEMLYRGELAL